MASPSFESQRNSSIKIGHLIWRPKRGHTPAVLTSAFADPFSLESIHTSDLSKRQDNDILLKFVVENQFPSLRCLNLSGLGHDECAPIFSRPEHFPVLEDLRVTLANLTDDCFIATALREEDSCLGALKQFCHSLPSLTHLLLCLANDPIDIPDPNELVRFIGLPVTRVSFQACGTLSWSFYYGSSSNAIQVSANEEALFHACYPSLFDKVSALNADAAKLSQRIGRAGSLPVWIAPILSSALTLAKADVIVARMLLEVVSVFWVAEESSIAWPSMFDQILHDCLSSALFSSDSYLSGAVIRALQCRGNGWLESSHLSDIFSTHGDLFRFLARSISIAAVAVSSPKFFDHPYLLEPHLQSTTEFYVDRLYTCLGESCEQETCMALLSRLPKFVEMLPFIRYRMFGHVLRSQHFILADDDRAVQLGRCLPDAYHVLFEFPFDLLNMGNINLSRLKKFVSTSMLHFHGMEWGEAEEVLLTDAVWFRGVLHRSPNGLDAALGYNGMIPKDVVAFWALQEPSFATQRAEFAQRIAASAKISRERDGGGVGNSTHA